MVGSGRRRGEVMVEVGEVEEGRLLTVLIEANELVTQDKKMSVFRCMHNSMVVLLGSSLF